MDRLKLLFDYQEFRQNRKIKAVTDEVYKKYLQKPEKLSDEELDVSAAGEPCLPYIFREKKGEEE